MALTPLAAAIMLLVAVASADPASQGPSKAKTGRALPHPEIVRRWHLPPLVPAPIAPDGRPALVLEMLNTGERLELLPKSLAEGGGFTADDLARASHALRDPRTDEECKIDARTVELVYQVEQHFAARAVRVVSAFRTPEGRSNHGKGRALDIVVPGARDDEVARFARTIGFVGVGLYPRSGFVHIDSRSRSFFWVDGSGPGQRGRVVPVFSKAAVASDAKARRRGEEPPSDEVAPDPDADHDEG
ncbi:MAG TPA: DUF882 domain-containing protein [Polyangiaceae bacterium]|nr:DUF882 domain-containing protein [Polyangiaceae bacterium]